MTTMNNNKQYTPPTTEILEISLNEIIAMSYDGTGDGSDLAAPDRDNFFDDLDNKNGESQSSNWGWL